MFEELWINQVHPNLREIIRVTKQNSHAKITYNPLTGMVIINHGPLSVKMFNAKTGELIAIS